MTNFDIERLPDEISRELLTLRSALLEEFEEAMRGKQASHRKAGRILKLIVHAPRSTAEGDGFAASESIDVLVIVNHRELADKDQHWRHALARLRRDRERGVLPREIRLDVHCLQDVNRALVSGLPYLASIVRRGIVLYELDRTPLATPRNLPSDERCWRGRAEFERWYPRAEDFLSGASFYRDEGNMRMAALLLHQACEHLYQCVFWTVMLHGRRTHSLDELRGLAEGLDERLRSVWPRTSRFERRCFAQVRRAYVEARYEPSFPRQADQWTTAASYVSGAPSVGFRQDNGTMITGFGDGHDVFDMSQAMSRLDVSPNLNTSFFNETREQASEAHRQAVGVENLANEIRTATHTNRSAYGTSTERASGWDSGSGSQANTSIERFDRRTGTTSEGLEERSTIAQNERASRSHGQQAETSDVVSGTISAGIGGGRGGGQVGQGGGQRGGRIASPGAGLMVSKSGTQNDQMRYETNDTRSSDSGNTSSSGFRDDHANGTGASVFDGTYSRGGSFSRASRMSSSSMSTEDALALADSYSESARKLEELSQQLSREASYAETHGMQMSQNLSQELANWYRAQQAANPGLNAPELWATDLTPQQRQVREGMIARWMQDRHAAIRGEIQSLLHAPDLVDVHAPTIGSAADVERRYHPHGLSRLPAGPGGGDPGAAGRIISAGKAETDDARAAAQSMRGQRVQGNVDLQGEVNQGLDHDFFRDPKLRQ